MPASYVISKKVFQVNHIVHPYSLHVNPGLLTVLVIPAFPVFFKNNIKIVYKVICEIDQLFINLLHVKCKLHDEKYYK